MADYRKPNKRGWGLPIAITVAGVAILAFTGWRLLKTEGSPVISVTGSPDSWTHKELAEHFERRGPSLKMIEASNGPFGSAVFFVVRDSEAAADSDRASRAWRGKSDDVVYCRLYRTSQEAKDDAGSGGDEAFASGRFAFRGTPKALSRIKPLLQ